jgi:Ca2+:H+ antiporter
VSILFRKIAGTPLLWFLVFVPVLLAVEVVSPGAHTLLFVLSIFAIVPLAALLSLATEAVAERTGDAAGGLINATLGNLTELVIAVTALAAGQYALVKASIAGAIVTNTLFMLGACFLLGGLKHHVQTFNLAGARLQASLLFIATVALLVPSAIASADRVTDPQPLQTLSFMLAILLIGGYVLGLVFSLGTHRDDFASAAHEEHGEALPIGVALVTLGVTTVLVALVSHVFVASVEVAGEAMGLSPAFVGFIVVSLVGGAAEFASAFSAARKDRLDLSVSIALGSASQIALFVAPLLVLLSYVVGPTPMGLDFWPGAVVMMLIAALSTAILTAGGHSTWFLGVLVLMVYAIFALTLYVVPPLQ